MLEKYKKRIYKIFNPSDIVRMGFSIDTAQQVLAEFADICVNDNGKWYGDLALYFAEFATDFTLGYGDIDEDSYIESDLESAILTHIRDFLMEMGK